MEWLFTLADARILLWLNHALAPHPRLFELGLFLTDTGADVATLATIGWLWFWRASRSPITRQASRARLIVFAGAGMAAFITARLIAFALDVDRPFTTYLPVHGTPGAFEGLRTYGSFPSDHAALLAALPLALFSWNRRVAWMWAGLALLLVVVRVAVGFHYPSDMLAGIALGLAFSAAAMRLFDRSETVHATAIWVAGGFSRAPQSYALYGLGALVVLEFAMHFRHVLRLLFVLRSAVAGIVATIAVVVVAAGCSSIPTSAPLDLSDDGVYDPSVVKNTQGETLLYNFRTVERGVLYRGSDFTRTLRQGASGGSNDQPVAFQDGQTFDFLRSRNIRRVVSLAPTSDFYPEEGYLRYWTERTGYAITASSVPVAGDEAYARSDRSGLHAAAELLAIMQRRRPGDGAVLVHGEAGTDATGVVAAAYELSRRSTTADGTATWHRVLQRYLVSNALLPRERRSGAVTGAALEALRTDLLFLATL